MDADEKVAWPEIVLDQGLVLSSDSDEMAALKKTACEVAQIINEKMPKIELQMKALSDYKKEYDGRGAFSQWWDNNIMEEKRNEMIAVTMNSSECQIKVVRFIAFLNVILNQQQKALGETQKEMKSQAELIEAQQLKLEKQNDKLVQHQQKLEEDNRAIIEGCEVLKKLRNAIVDHDQKLDAQGKSLSGMDRLILELRGLYKDFEVYQSNINLNIKQETSEVRHSMDLIKKDLARIVGECQSKFEGDLCAVQEEFTALIAKIDALEAGQVRVSSSADALARFVAKTQRFSLLSLAIGVLSGIGSVLIFMMVLLT